MNNLWITKYTPKNFQEFIGNTGNILLMKKWINHFHHHDEEFPNFKNGLLISGVSGIGKTTIAKILLKEYGYDVIECNASEVRSVSSIKSKLKSIIDGRNIMMMMKKNIVSGLIFDELDGITGGEKHIIQQLILFLQNQQIYSKKIAKTAGSERQKRSGKNNNLFLSNVQTTRTKKIAEKLGGKSSKKSGGKSGGKNEEMHINMNPMICICNHITSSIKSLIKNCVHIKFSPPTEDNLYEYMMKIIKNENLKIDPVCAKTLIKYCQRDIRRTVILLENLKSYFKNQQITPEKLKSVIKSFAQKDFDISLFESVRQINQNKITIDESLNLFYNDKSQIPLLIHQNFNKNLINNILDNRTNKINSMKKYYSNLIHSNIIDNYIFNCQQWNLNNYVGLLSCYSANYELNHRDKVLKYYNIERSPVKSKLNYKFYNLKLINEICRKLMISISNFQNFTCVLFELFVFNDPALYLNNDMDSVMKQKYNKIFTFMKKRNITIKNFDKAIKLSYLFLENAKLYNKRKKYLEIIYENFTLHSH